MVAFAAKPLNGLGPLGGRHLESASTCRWWRPPKCPGQPGITVRRGRPLTLRTADRVVAFMDRYEVVAGSAEAVRLGGPVARWIEAEVDAWLRKWLEKRRDAEPGKRHEVAVLRLAPLASAGAQQPGPSP